MILGKRLRIEGTVLRSRSDDEKAAVTGSFVDANLALFLESKLTPVVDRTFDMVEVRAAHEYLESNASFGNVVVRVG